MNYRKGMGLIFPNLAMEISPIGLIAVTQTNQEILVGVPGRVFFSL